MARLAKPSREPPQALLVTELWGLGDLALAVPFLRAAAAKTRVTLLAKPHAAPILTRFAPGVDLVPLVAPWTAFRGKYRLHRWPWDVLGETVRLLRTRRFDIGVSARPDPRDHALLAASGARERIGFPRAGSGLLLDRPLPPPAGPHRADYWNSLAAELGWTPDPPASTSPRSGRHLVMHAGAAQRVRRWPRERFEEVAAGLRAVGWQVDMIDDDFTDLEGLLDRLAAADRFIGNDSGPGHLAALLGVPTFTIFGPQLPELFAPRHPGSRWIEGAPCPYKPCRDYCRFAEPNCLLAVTPGAVLRAVEAWLSPAAARAAVP